MLKTHAISPNPQGPDSMEVFVNYLKQFPNGTVDVQQLAGDATACQGDISRIQSVEGSDATWKGPRALCTILKSSGVSSFKCPTNKQGCEAYRDAAFRKAGVGLNASNLGRTENVLGYGIFAPSGSCDVCSGFGICSNVTRSCECSPLAYENGLVLADGATLAVDNITRNVFRGQVVASGKTCSTMMTRYVTPVGIVALGYIMAIVLVVVSVSFSAFYHINRTHSVIRFSSRKFCQIVHVGGIVAAVTVLVIVQDPLHAPWKCALEPWLLAFSYTLVFAPLMAKTYKVWCVCV